MSESDWHAPHTIACTLTPIELETRRKELNGVASVIEAERGCCRFLRFRLTIEPHGGPLWMEVTGSEGTRLP